MVLAAFLTLKVPSIFYNACINIQLRDCNIWLTHFVFRRDCVFFFIFFLWVPLGLNAAVANPTMVQMAASYLTGADEGSTGPEMPSLADTLGAGALLVEFTFYFFFLHAR